MNNRKQTNRSVPTTPEFKIDPRVPRTLDCTGLDYEEAPDGDFFVLLRLEADSPTQVIVSSRTEDIFSVEQRCIIAAGASSLDPWWGEQLWHTLLDQNGQHAMGAWEVASHDGVEVAIFKVMLPANASGDEMRAAIIFTVLKTHELRIHLQDRFQMN